MRILKFSCPFITKNIYHFILQLLIILEIKKIIKNFSITTVLYPCHAYQEIILKLWIASKK